MLTNLAPEQSQYLSAAVASGRYQSEIEALNEAVRLLKHRDELKAMLEVGEKDVEAGRCAPAEEVFERLERRAAELDNQSRESQQ